MTPAPKPPASAIRLETRPGHITSGLLSGGVPFSAFHQTPPGKIQRGTGSHHVIVNVTDAGKTRMHTMTVNLADSGKPHRLLRPKLTATVSNAPTGLPGHHLNEIVSAAAFQRGFNVSKKPGVVFRKGKWVLEPRITS